MSSFAAPEGYAYRHRNSWVPEDLRDRPGNWREELAGYYGICERIDECYGRLLDALEREGELENTIVLFTSDHGCHFITRPGKYKRTPHESSIHVPAVLRGPGFEGGNRVEEPVSLLDVVPSLIDAAGIDVPAAMEGDSILPLLDGKTDDWKDGVFVQPISSTEVARTLRTDRWTYSVYAPDRDGSGSGQSDTYVERQLFDLKTDPHQSVNLIGRGDHADVAVDLRERLRERIREVEGMEVEIQSTHYPA